MNGTSIQPETTYADYPTTDSRAAVAIDGIDTRRWTRTDWVMLAALALDQAGSRTLADSADRAVRDALLASERALELVAAP